MKRKNKLVQLLSSEGVMYIIVGCLTTLVNLIVFTIFNEGIKASGISELIAYKLAYVIAFVIAVIFAYWTNKFWVFHNYNMKAAYLWKEFCGFALARITSGIVTFLLMMLCVDLLYWNEYLAWFLTTVFNLVFNYVASKFWIFKK